MSKHEVLRNCVRRAMEKLRAVGAEPTDIRMPPEIEERWIAGDADYDRDRPFIESLRVSEVSKQFLPERLYVCGRSATAEVEHAHLCCAVLPDDDLVYQPVRVERRQ